METLICTEVTESAIFGEYKSLREGWVQNLCTLYETVFSKAFSASCFLQHFAFPCYTVSCRKTPPNLQIVRSISQHGRYKGILFSSTNSMRSLMLLGLFQHSLDRIFVAPGNFFFYTVAGIFPNSQCLDWHHDPKSIEKELLLRHLFQTGLRIALNLILTQSLLFSTSENCAQLSHQTHCLNKPKVQNKVIPMKIGQSQATNWNTRSEPEEVTNVILNTVSFQLHILSFSSDSCSQLVLLETVRRFY